MTADIHALAGPYALDAVDDLERLAFERHLRDCDACRTEVAELAEAAARLADGAWSVPPPALRDRVLAEITTTRQLAPAAAPAAAPARRSAPRWQRWTAAAAVVVAVTGAGTAVYFVQEQRVRREQTVAAQARAAEARIRAILAAPDLVVREQPLRDGGRVTVAVSRLHDAGIVMLAADAAPADGRVYQLWTVRDRLAVPEKALVPGQAATVTIVEGLPAASDVGVTVEPAPGSATPTLPMVADVKMT